MEGDYPFSGENSLKMEEQICTSEIPVMKNLYSENLKGVICKMLDKVFIF
jgi:hypothetical protein